MVGEYPKPAVSLVLQSMTTPNAKPDGLSGGYHRRLSSTAKQTSMYHMLGSFYSHIWVGTPPQRVSVIVDTGSHYTAFPCVGCTCGKHMDPYFDPKKSSSSSIPVCSGTKCYFKQSYSEGSSWHAYKVRDEVWIGGESLLSGPNASNLSTKFEFGCQDMETGLFRTQYVDGIMGLAGAEDTLPHILHARGVAKSKVFAMCFRLGGGILTIGGVDSSIHARPPNPTALPSSVVIFAKQMARKPAGWFAVRLLDVLLRHSKTGETKSIGVPAYKYNTGKGAIIDSGTTDTYLPSSSAHNFASLFRQLSGITYSNSKRDLTREEFDNLPTVIYCLEDISGNTMYIESPPSSYTEAIVRHGFTISAQPRYAFRIYLTEPSGTVLGANFMLGYNVIFDYDGRRIGFAKSDCQAQVTTNSSDSASKGIPKDTSLRLLSPYSAAVKAPIFAQLEDIYTTFKSGCNRQGGIAFLGSACNATCSDTIYATKEDRLASIFIVSGVQEWNIKNGCSNFSTVISRSERCLALCSVGAETGEQLRLTMLRQNGLTPCSVGAWSHCRSNCTQERLVLSPETQSTYLRSVFGTSDKDDQKGGKRCVPTTEVRKCHAYRCPVYAASLVAFDIRIANLRLDAWSYVHREDLFLGLSRALNVCESQFHAYSLPAQVGNFISLQVQLRLPANQHGGKKKCAALGEAIAQTALRPSFPTVLTLLLNGNNTQR